MKVFLSYASEYVDLAESICLALNSDGHDVFFDRSRLLPSGDYNQHIRKAVKESDIFVFLISPESVKKGSYALSELAIAKKKWAHPKKKVIPVIVHPTPFENIPVYLQSITFLEPEGNIPIEVCSVVDTLNQGTSFLRIRSKFSLAALIGFVIILAFQNSQNSNHNNIGTISGKTKINSKTKLTELISIFEFRANELLSELTKLSDVEGIHEVRQEFETLHAQHVAALESGNLILAHEILRKIYKIFSDHESNREFSSDTTDLKPVSKRDSISEVVLSNINYFASPIRTRDQDVNARSLSCLYTIDHDRVLAAPHCGNLDSEYLGIDFSNAIASSPELLEEWRADIVQDYYSQVVEIDSINTIVRLIVQQQLENEN